MKKKNPNKCLGFDLTDPEGVSDWALAYPPDHTATPAERKALHAVPDRIAKALRVLEVVEGLWRDNGFDDPAHVERLERESRVNTMYTAEDVLLDIRAALDNDGSE